MKYTTVAVAALAGVAVADSWDNYSTTKSTTKSVDPEATWTSWDPKTPKPTGKGKGPKDGEHWDDWDPEHPEKIGTWGEWDPKHPKPTAKPTTASHWADWDPEHPDKVGTWGEWDPKHPKPTSKSTTASHWDDWDPEHPEKIGTWGSWSKHPKPTSKKGPKHGEHWDDWDPEHPEKTGTWGTWKEPEATTTWTEWEAEPTETSTWTEWDPSGKPITVTVTKTNSWETWSSTKVPAVVVTSVVKAGWSSDGWFGPAWPTVTAGGCGKNIVTSYGPPIWKPVPEPSTTSTWSEWKETAISTSTWSEWKETATSTSTWSEWKSTSTSAAKPKPTGDKGSAVIAPNGNKWSMTYSPYQANTDCKTEETVKKDIKKLADLGFTSVRVYSTDCKTLEYVGAACRENKLKLILGVFISKTGIEGAKPQVDDIVKWAQWDIVELIVIGNEAVFQGFCKAEELAAFIKYSKDAFKKAGYTGGCTTTEPLAEWEKEGWKFCEVVDVVSANLYAYFNADTTCDKAGDFIQAQVDILGGICKGKETYVMESGWPSEGVCNGKACPSKENQKTAIKKIQETVGAKVVFFSFEDEQWKEPGQFGVEQHWGCGDVFEGADWTSYDTKKDKKPEAAKPKDPKDDKKDSWSKW